jgi:D-alanine-D-alanine ligase
VFFIEANALPSLEPGATVHASAALAGLGTMEAVLDAVIKSAVERYGIQISVRSRNRRKALKVGFTFNLKRIRPLDSNDDDREAEFDSRATIDAIIGAIASHGHEVVEIEATPELPSIIGSMPLDIVFNIAEGMHGRNRESQVPAILELLNIPYVGSDPAALSICLDKVLAKKMVRQAGIHTADFIVMRTGKERLPRNLHFPVIIKPVAEGSSKGVMGMNVVQDEADLRRLSRELLLKYHQPVLVEEYLSGREFTVGLLGENRPKVLPPMEILFNNEEDRFPVYAFEHKLDTNKSISYQVPANIDRSLQKNLEHVARCAFTALGCRDVARVDLRLDRNERIHFIECNPLPGLTPGWSDLCIIGEAAGMDYRTLIGEIMAPAIRRMKVKEKA